MEGTRGLLGAGALVALGLAVAGLAVGAGIGRVREAPAIVSVRGVSERDVTADLATWTLATQANGPDLSAVQAIADRDAATIRAYFAARGFEPGELSVRGSGVNQYYDSQRGQMVVTLRQRFQARTTDIQRMEKAFAEQAELIRQGVALDADAVGGVVYSFTRLNEVKPEMIAEATKAAREAAEQFATDSGTKVGGIARATQGLFSITGRDGDPGVGTETPAQKVRVVTTVEFRLEN